ncbi:hypothetical protein AINA4_10410 [Aurantimicrobium sp. INA4]|uniref:hypothetical protein n=1 Tax=Aurantimicrobium sp. INA4 TaxID=2986279 RepID=UPI002491D95D|nr:hypothetical protein [Aurantimicrobium sp. INA4]BDU11120.1 hypothetical protein AINA4_10410 [Aurantimicrobium sp. INA4]
MSTHEDDALSWAGDEDRLVTGAPQSAKRDARGASSVNSSTKEAGDGTGENVQTGLSSIALVGFGIFGGIYLLYSVAWLITALRNPTQIADPLGNSMFVLGLWLAVAAPSLWFAAVLYLGLTSSVTKRMVYLLLGAFVLIPWPYLAWAG